MNNISSFVVTSGWFKPVKRSITDTKMIHIALLNLAIFQVIVYMIEFISDEFN